MPTSTNLPRGCSSMRGTSDIHRVRSRGGGRTHQTNRLYMLNVRHESLTIKKQTLENQLKAIKDQLRGIDADMLEAEKIYKQLKKNGRSRKAFEEKTFKKMPLKF